jgi:hypothetical protein
MGIDPMNNISNNNKNTLCSYIISTPTSHSAYYNYGFTNPQKGIWLFTILNMINPQKEIDLMNNISIINRILFAVTLFQHSPLTRRVSYNSIR